MATIFDELENLKEAEKSSGHYRQQILTMKDDLDKLRKSSCAGFEAMGQSLKDAFKQFLTEADRRRVEEFYRNAAVSVSTTVVDMMGKNLRSALSAVGQETGSITRIGQGIGNALGMGIGLALGNPLLGQALASVLGSAGGFLQQQIEGPEIMGARRVVQASGGDLREVAASVSKFTEIGVKYNALLRETRFEIGMTEEQSDRYYNKLAEYGIKSLDPVAKRAAQSAMIAEKFGQLGEGTGLQVQSSALGQYGDSLKSADKVFNMVLHTQKELRESYDKTGDSVARSLGSGASMTEVLAQITSQGRNASASITALTAGVLAMMKVSVRGGGGPGTTTIARPGKVQATALNFMTGLLGNVAPSSQEDMSRQGAFLYQEILNRSEAGRRLLERIRQNARKRGVNIDGRDALEKGEIPYSLQEIMSPDNDKDGKIAGLYVNAVSAGLLDFLETNGKLDPAKFAIMQANIPFLQGFDGRNTYELLKRQRATTGLGTMESYRKQREDLRKGTLGGDLPKVLEDIARGQTSLEDKISAGLSEIVEWTRGYFPNLKDTIAKIMYPDQVPIEVDTSLGRVASDTYNLGPGEAYRLYQKRSQTATSQQQAQKRYENAKNAGLRTDYVTPMSDVEYQNVTLTNNTMRGMMWEQYSYNGPTPRGS